MHGVFNTSGVFKILLYYRFGSRGFFRLFICQIPRYLFSTAKQQLQDHLQVQELFHLPLSRDAFQEFNQFSNLLRSIHPRVLITGHILGQMFSL
jgi:hypothetical protein